MSPTQRRRYLALDMATKTGWAHSNGASGVWDLKIFPDESSGMRLIRFESKIHEIAKGPGIDVICYEAVNVNSGPKANTKAFKLSCHLEAIVKRLAEVYDYECTSCNLQTLKAYALPGEKKRDKAAMVAAAERRWPQIPIEDDNHADALWLLDWIQSTLVEA